MIVACATFWAPTAHALIVNSNATTSAPADDPGWANHTVPGSRDYVYLGDGWALTARHIGPTGTAGETLTFSTGTYSLIPGQNHVVSNPTSYVNSSGQTINLSLTGQTDLRLVRINGDPDLTDICSSRSNCAIATSSPSLGAEVTFIGTGPSRTDTVTTWNGHTGFTFTINNVKRWGTNQLSNVNDFQSPSPGLFTQVLSSTTGILPLKTPDGITRDVISMITRYDHSGSASLPEEAQAVPGDSGSSVFSKNSTTGEWELAGIVNAAFRYNDQPSNSVLDGNATTIADLSFYRDVILDLMEANANYSLVTGDINLDGVLSGGTSGGTPTGDVAAFVAGWGYDNGLGVGDINTWKKGDLNRDGKVDVADFVILRNALNGTSGGGGSLTLNSLFGLVGVPEPSSLLLALAGAGLAFRYRFRHSRL